VICAGVTEWADRYEGEPFHALLCDPPYNFQFMGKDWDNAVAMHPEIWVALSKHLHPGAFVFAFGGARTYHRLAVALEDAGLRIHPAIGWVNGQGFPKSTRVDTQIDKAAGKLGEREFVGWKVEPNGRVMGLESGAHERVCNPSDKPDRKFGADNRPLRERKRVFAPATPLAQTWEGHRYGGQVLRPCLELIAVAQKPYEGKPVDDITESGAGTLWVEGGRITATDKARFPAGYSKGIQVVYAQDQYSKTWLSGSDRHPSGRWPSNFLLSHIPQEVCPDCGGVGHFTFPTWYAKTRKNGGTLARWMELTSCGMLGCVTCEGKGVVGGCRQVSGEWECVDGCGAQELGDKARYYFQSDWNHEIAERTARSSCSICLAHLTKHGIMNETKNRGLSCKDVNGAENHLSPNKNRNDSAVALVAQKPLREGADKSDSSNTHANAVEKSGLTTLETSESTVLGSVPLTRVAQLAHSVKSAASLCDSCATAIAQSLVQLQQGQGPVSILGLDSISEHKKQTLIQSLVSSVRSLENTDITQITTNQSILSGIVQNATGNYMAKTGCVPIYPPFHSYATRQIERADPIRYQAKAARRERDIGLVALPLQTFNRVNPGGLEHEPRWAPTEVRNPHPTVKPITLNRYLATLLLPPDIYAPRRLLVPFAGVASEMIGAHLAGWEEVVGIEMSQEYCDIGEMRLDWWRRASREAGTTDVKKILKWARKQE